MKLLRDLRVGRQWTSEVGVVTTIVWEVTHEVSQIPRLRPRDKD